MINNNIIIIIIFLMVYHVILSIDLNSEDQKYLLDLAARREKTRPLFLRMDVTQTQKKFQKPSFAHGLQQICDLEDRTLVMA